MPTFAGQHALVIGGSSGMGLGTARALAARGATVAVTSSAPERVDAAIEAVRDGLQAADGATDVGAVTGVVCDLNDEASVRAAVEAHARIDHLVVTAAPARGSTDREFFDGKFWGTQVAATAAAQRMPESGTILFASGGMAVRPVAGSWSVACAFAAIEGLTRALAIELAPRRVNCLRPGLFDTNTFAGMDDAQRAQVFAAQTEGLPVGRPAQGDEFGLTAVGLIASTYLTGEVVALDGGAALLAR